MTGIALESSDPRADHAELASSGVDVDPELTGGDGVVPLLFFFRDNNKNHLMVAEAQIARGSGRSTAAPSPCGRLWVPFAGRPKLRVGCD